MIILISGSNRPPLRPQIEPRRKAGPLSPTARERRGPTELGMSEMPIAAIPVRISAHPRLAPFRRHVPHVLYIAAMK